MKQPIKQMLIAGAIGATIVTTGFILVGIGTAEEQKAAQETVQEVMQEYKATPPVVVVKVVETLNYFEAVPLDKGLQDYIIRECERKDIDPAIVMAMIFRESNYKADTIGDNGNSFGLMQIQPRWHYGRMLELESTDLFNPYHNVAVGIDYLCELLSKYDGDMAKALVAYNQGSYKGTVTAYAKAVLEAAEALGGANVYEYSR